MLSNSIRKSAVTVAAIAAAGFGGAAIAGAADNESSSSSAPSERRHAAREALSAADAARVKAAALEQAPGATVLRTEAGGPYDAPYHAHIRTPDGTERVVLVDSSFEATTVVADRGRGGRGPGGPGHHGGRDETALTGTTKQRVEAAVKASYASATIDRSETNADSSAPYESHITTRDGRELEVLVSKDFKVVDASEHPARP